MESDQSYKPLKNIELVPMENKEKSVVSRLQVMMLIGLSICLCFSFTWQKEKKIDLVGSVWKYYSNGEYNGYSVQFLADGKLLTGHPADVTPYNDGWEQKGKKVKLWFNDHFSDYSGKVISSSLIRGKAVNILKKSWAWELRRERLDNTSKTDSLAQ